MIPQQIFDMITHILTEGVLDPWSWIAILFLLFTVVLPLLVIIAVSILVILLLKKLINHFSTAKKNNESKATGN